MPKKGKVGRKRKPFFVDPIEMKNELIEYKKTNIISEKLGKMVQDIANRYASRPNFINYPFKDDFISESIFRMIQQMDKLDVNRPDSNPFAYLTLTAHRVFIQMIKKEKRILETKENLHQKMIESGYIETVTNQEELKY